MEMEGGSGKVVGYEVGKWARTDDVRCHLAQGFQPYASSLWIQ